MKLITFEHDPQTRIGALKSESGGDVVVDLSRAEPGSFTDMLSFLEAGDEARELAEQAVAAASEDAVLKLTDVTLRAPIPRPGKIICIGLNYLDHAAESNLEVPEYPTVFSKHGNAVNDPGGAIVIPAVTSQVDYEGELAVVIGRRAKNVSESDALDYVAGYMPFNDVSARDYQRRTSQWTIGKTFDTFAPMGPALVTADEVPDPHDLDMRVTVDGEVLQHSNTGEMIFSIPHLIWYLSAVMTLDPGDVIATGTPAGVGVARKPPRFLRPGEIVQVEIESLGRLENPVVEV